MLTDVLIAAAASGVFAMVMGLFFQWLHRRYVTPVDFPNKELAGEIEQTRALLVNRPPDKALIGARVALQAVPKIKNVVSTRRNIKAKTRVTFRTFGETIAIKATPVGTDSTELTIESKPRFSGTAVDYGKSYENVERIVAKLVSSHGASLVSANNSFKPTPLRGVGKAS